MFKKVSFFLIKSKFLSLYFIIFSCNFLKASNFFFKNKLMFFKINLKVYFRQLDFFSLNEKIINLMIFLIFFFSDIEEKRKN